MSGSDLTDAISRLSGSDALDLLRRIAEGVGAAAPGRGESEAVAALAVVEPTAPPENGRAAQLALCLLTDDPTYDGPIRAMLANSPAKRLGIEPITGALLTGALLLALQTHVEFVKNIDGKWSLKVIKKPTNEGIIGPLIKKLAELLK